MIVFVVHMCRYTAPLRYGSRIGGNSLLNVLRSIEATTVDMKATRTQRRHALTKLKWTSS